MKGLKQCGLFALSFVLFSTVFFSAFSDNASALSTYDKTINISEIAEIKNGLRYADVTNYWYSILFSEDTEITIDDVEYDIQYAKPSQAFLDGLADAIPNGYYGLTTRYYQDQIELMIFYSNNASANVSFQTLGGDRQARVTSPNNELAVTYMLMSPSTNSISVSNTSMTTGGITISHDPIDNPTPWLNKTVFSTFPVNYPTGYSGLNVPLYPLQRQTPRPEINLEVDDKTIKATYAGNLLGVPNLSWHIEKASDNSTILDHNIETKTTLNYTFTTNDTYRLVLLAQYATVPLDANPYDPELYTPPPYILGLTFDIDGSKYSIDTVTCQEFGQECTDLSSVYEKCDLFDINCHIRNGLTAIKRWLGVDEFSDITESPFTTFSSDTFGLTAVIVAPLSFIENLNAGTCSPISLPLPVFGNAEIPCMSSIYSSSFPAFYTIAQVIVNALVGYYVMVRLLALVKGFKDPHNDRIEVLQL